MSETKTTPIEIGGERLDVPVRVPLLPVRNTVVFPGVTLPLSVGRAASLAAVQAAARNGGFLAVATQRAPETETPRLEDLYPVGTLTKIVHLAETGSGISVAVVGLARVRLQALARRGHVTPTSTPRCCPTCSTRPPRPRRRAAPCSDSARSWSSLRDDIPEEAAQILDRFDDPARLADVIAFNGTMPLPEKVELLAQQDVLARLRALMRYLMREIRIAQVSKTLRRARRRRDRRGRAPQAPARAAAQDPRASSARTTSRAAEGDELRDAPRERGPADRGARGRRARGRPAAPACRLTRPSARSRAPTSSGCSTCRGTTQTDDNLDLAHARRILDEDHYDLEKVKERILEYLAVRQLVPRPEGPDPVLRRPAGRRQDVARQVDRARAWAASSCARRSAACATRPRSAATAAPTSARCPGRILQSLKTAGTRNPVFMLDEIDKVGMDYRGDPSSALLEVLDPEQNSTFSDHYLEVPFDLSKVLFVATANRADTIPRAAARPHGDHRAARLHRDGEAAHRAATTCCRASSSEHGLAPSRSSSPTSALCAWSRATRARPACAASSASIAALVRKAALQRRRGRERAESRRRRRPRRSCSGPRAARAEMAERTDRPGVATGLAWTPVGGDLVFVEARAHGGQAASCTSPASWAT